MLSNSAGYITVVTNSTGLIQKTVESSGHQCQLIKGLPEHSEMGLIGKVLFAALSARFVHECARRPDIGTIEL